MFAFLRKKEFDIIEQRPNHYTLFCIREGKGLVYESNINPLENEAVTIWPQGNLDKWEPVTIRWLRFKYEETIVSLNGVVLGRIIGIERSSPENILRSIDKELKYLEEDASKKKSPLVVIKLQDINSVPEIFYEGKKLDWLVDVKFEWIGDTEDPGECDLHISHISSDNKVGYVHSKF